jgi:drug/metabolite transporter (DMT)-like permease
MHSALIDYWQSLPKTTRAAMALLIACLIWSGWWVLNRHSIQNGMNPYDIMAIRLGVAGMAMLPILLRMGLGTTWPRAIILGLVGGLCNSLLAIYGVKFAPASHGAALMPGVGPIFTALLAWLILDESLPTKRWLGIIVVISGAFLIGVENFANAQPDQWLGHLMFIGSSLCWAFYIVGMRLWAVGPWQGAAMAAVFGMIIYVPLYSILGGSLEGYSVTQLAVQGLYQGIITSVIAFSLFNYALGVFGAAGTGAAGASIPVFTTLLGIILLGEYPSWIVVAGMLTVIAGLPLAIGLVGAAKTPAIADQPKKLGTRYDTSA